MKVLNGEDVASRTGPESCVAFREERGEALTGDCVGQPLSGVKQLRDADAFRPVEGNTANDDIASHAPIPRRRRPWHAQTPPAREPGYLWIVPSIYRMDRIGKAGGRSR